MTFNAFITAGGRISGKFAELVGTDIKALIKIDGKSMLERTIEALRSSEVIGRIALVSPEETRTLPDVKGIDDFIPADPSGVENIRQGLQHFKDDEFVVLCNSDLPFINAYAIKDFIKKCSEDAVVCYPIFEKNEIDPTLRPGIPSYVKLRDGQFTGGSIFKLKTKPCLERMEQIGKSFNSRKSSLAMASLLGWKIVIKFALGLCSLDEIIERANEIMGGKCAAIRGCDPAITIDIDDERAYRFAIEYTKRGGESGMQRVDASIHAPSS